MPNCKWLERKGEDDFRSSKFFVATSYFELRSSQFEVAPQVGLEPTTLRLTAGGCAHQDPVEALKVGAAPSVAFPKNHLAQVERAIKLVTMVKCRSMSHSLQIVATCALGLEEILAAELRDLRINPVSLEKGAVLYTAGWEMVWRCNWRLRTANRVLVKLGDWGAEDGDGLAAGIQRLVRTSNLSWQGLAASQLFSPDQTLSIRATSSASKVKDTRWVALRVKDGLVDAQREKYGRRSSVDKEKPDLHLRVWLHRDRASLLLDTSGEPLDRRGYRVQTTVAPLRENLAAACVLKSAWDGRGPILDPMCGSATLLAEAASIAMGKAAGQLRQGWSFQRLPNYDKAVFSGIREEPIPSLSQDVQLFGIDRSGKAIQAARLNLKRAGLLDRAVLKVADAFDFVPPAGPGLLLVNPPHGERLAESPEQWKKLGDLFKQRYAGWRAVVLAGGRDLGKHIGLRPSFRLPVKNGPLQARILGFELY